MRLKFTQSHKMEITQYRSQANFDRFPLAGVVFGRHRPERFSKALGWSQENGNAARRLSNCTRTRGQDCLGGELESYGENLR